jgi:hypothetical protein
MNGGTISHNYGFYTGGVSVTDTIFIMTGGTIADNESEYDGAGVRVSASTFTMTGGTISGNICKLVSGGGVWLTGASFNMSGGAITGNTATGAGGGVAVGIDGIFTMSGGTITDNTTSMIGGGVRVHSDGTFTMQGGIIAGNTAGSAGGGVYISGAGVFTKAPFDPDANNASGIIYGNDGSASRNKATLGVTNELNNMGHAVYIETGPKRRELTVMPDQRLTTTYDGEAGGWVE